MPCFHCPSTSETLFSTQYSCDISRGKLGDPCHKMRQSKLREMEWLSFPRSHMVSGRDGTRSVFFLFKAVSLMARDIKVEGVLLVWILIQFFSIPYCSECWYPGHWCGHSIQEAVERSWVWLIKDIVFSFRQSWNTNTASYISVRLAKLHNLIGLQFPCL